MAESWFGPLRFGPTGGIVTQALSIIGLAAIVATGHAIVTPESEVWIDPAEGIPVRASIANNVGLADPAVDPVMDPTIDSQLDPEALADPVESTDPESDVLGANISGEQAFALFVSGEADFLDARYAEDYEAGHIEGAFSVPYEEAAQRVIQLVADGWISPSKRVVVYCIGGLCNESKFVVRALLEAGFDPAMVHIDDGGYPAWKAAGHPTQSGPDFTQETP